MKNELLTINKTVLVNEHLFFVPGNYDALFDLNLDSWELSCRSNIPWSKESRSVQCYLVGNRIYCVSMGSLEIAVYDLDNKSINMLKGANPRENLCSFITDNKIWIFPRRLEDDLFYFDIESEQYVKYCAWAEWVLKNNLSGKLLIAAIKEMEIVITIQDTGEYITVQYPFLSFAIHKLEGNINLVCPIPFKGKHIFTVKNSYELVVAHDKGSYDKYKLMNEGDGYFVRGLGIGEGVILMGADQLYFWSEDKGFLEIDNTKIESFYSNGSLVVTYVNYKDYFFLMPWNSKFVIVLNSEMHIVEMRKLVYESNMWFEKCPCIYEGDSDTTLQDLIGFVVSKVEDAAGIEEQPSGFDIWESIKEEK